MKNPHVLEKIAFFGKKNQKVVEVQKCSKNQKILW